MKINEVDIDEIANREYDDSHNTNRHTLTSLFCLYMIDISIIKLGNKFVNAFVRDKEYNSGVERPLFLLFNFDYKTLEEEIYYKNLHQDLISRDEFITYYYVGDIKESKHVMYVFNVKEQFSNDYKLFMQGKYSQFSPELRDKIPVYHILSNGKRGEKTTVGQVVIKAPALRKYWEDRIGVILPDEAEVWSSPDIELVETI